MAFRRVALWQEAHTAEAIVRTVCGDVAPTELGACDAHERLFLVTPIQPGDDCTDGDAVVAEAQTLLAVADHVEPGGALGSCGTSVQPAPSPSYSAVERGRTCW